MALNLAFARNKEESLVHLVFPFCMASIWVLLLTACREITEDDFTSTMAFALSIAAFVSIFFFILKPIETIMSRFARIAEIRLENELLDEYYKARRELTRMKKRLDEINAIKPEQMSQEQLQERESLLREHDQARESFSRKERRFKGREGVRSPLFDSPLFSHTRNRLNLAGYLTFTALGGVGLSFIYSLYGWADGLVVGLLFVGLMGGTGLKWISEARGMGWKLTILEDFYEKLEKAGRRDLESVFTSCRLAIEIEDWQGAQAYLSLIEGT